MDIIDNFLDQDEFDELQTLIMSGDNFPWFFSSTIDYVDEEDKFQFTHMFYIEHRPVSQFCGNLHPILKKLRPKAIIRIKANLLTRTSENIQNAFHIDIEPVYASLPEGLSKEGKEEFMAVVSAAKKEGKGAFKFNDKEYPLLSRLDPPSTAPYTTSIFYMNTNNGYTEFEDGTKVESIANRIVSFPFNMEHTGTSCTDEQTRIVINFNYVK